VELKLTSFLPCHLYPDLHAVVNLTSPYCTWIALLLPCACGPYILQVLPPLMFIYFKWYQKQPPHLSHGLQPHHLYSWIRCRSVHGPYGCNWEVRRALYLEVKRPGRESNYSSHIMPRSEMVALYLHSSMLLQGVVLNFVRQFYLFYVGKKFTN
jgi:hypothetical protein